MDTLASPQAQLLSLQDCDNNIRELWWKYVNTSSDKKKNKIMVEIDSWLDTRNFVANMEGR